MLALAIIMIVWLGIWLWFAWQKHCMLQVITAILMNLDDETEEEGDTNE